MKYDLNSRLINCFLFTCLLFFANFIHSQGTNSSRIFDDSEISVVEIEMDSADLEWMLNPENSGSDSLHPARIHFVNSQIDEIVDSVGIRLRGNTSRESAKKSFKLSFNTFVPGRRFYGLDKINLNGEHNDPSIARSKICWDLYQKTGMRASRANHILVYINNEFFGIYINVEHIDEEFVKKNFNDSSGNLWKCLWPADLVYLGDNPDNYKILSGTRQIYDLKTNTEEKNYSSLARFIKIINMTPIQNMKDSLEKVLHLTSLLKYMSINVLTGSWDDYRYLKNNYYLYHEPASDLIYVIPYDYDNTFGIDWFGINWASIDPYEYARNDNSPRPMTEAILKIPEYKNLYTHYLELIANNIFKVSLSDNGLQIIESMLTPYAENDIYRVLDYNFSIKDFHDSYKAEHYEKYHVKNSILEFANERYTSLLSQLRYETAVPAVYYVNHFPENPSPADSIDFNVYAFGFPPVEYISLNLNSASGEFYSFNMRYKPVDNSVLPEDSDRWTVTVPPLGPYFAGDFYIEATNQNGTKTRYPEGSNIPIKTESEPAGEVLINEIMARNSATISDEYGEFDDWFEIFNPSTEPVDLRGKFLTDSRNNLSKWLFRESIVIEPNSVLLIWCDEDSSQGNLHTNFRLDGDGEFLAIVHSDSITIIDSLSFPDIPEDISYGRKFTDLLSWSFMEPSPGKLNTLVGFKDYKNKLPFEFEIANYPNPFNPFTKIAVFLSRRTEVNIEIFNTLGEQVWRKDLGSIAPGRHEVEWNRSLSQKGIASSGVYIAQVRAGTERRSIKLLLMK